MSHFTPAQATLTKKAGRVYRALNHSLRQEILNEIGEGEMTVTDLYRGFKIEQSIMSSHLKILREAGFVKTRRSGKFTYYSVSNTRFSQIIDASNTLIV